MLTGYAVGVIDEKFNNGKLTSATADAIAEMAEAIGEGTRRELLEEFRAADPEAEQ